MQFTISALVSLAAVVSAASADISGSCDNNNYSASQVNKAASAACDLVKAGRSVGNNNYPHKYNNYEKIDFQAPGPWYEFPIKNNGIFDGNSGPGADRVIINDKCDVAGLITHSGATGNGFVTCKVSSSGGDKPSTSSSAGRASTTEKPSATEKPSSSSKSSASPTSSSAKPSATDGKSAGFSIHGQKDTTAWAVAGLAAALMARIL